MFRQLNDRVSVAPQIGLDDLAEASRLGIRAVINNRPDGEEAGQPASDTIAAAAQQHGLRYHHVPMPLGAGLTHDQVASMAEILRDSDGPVLAYCKSGTRSCILWAFAAASQGYAVATILDQARDAGYSLDHLRDGLIAAGGS